MVIGLLALTGIPTATGVAFAVQEQRRANAANDDEKLLQKFTLSCWCEGQGRASKQLHGGRVVLGEEKIWIQPPHSSPSSPPFHPFRGFYIAYPDEERPQPAPLGLVSTISDDPPVLNWIYVDTATFELKYGNRTQSRPHWVGSWRWTEEEGEEEPGGLTLDGEERFVVVEPGGKGGRWEVRWDKGDDLLKGVEGVEGVEGRKVLRVSLERAFVEMPKEKEAGKAGEEDKKK
ncbi:hypothetical protein MMC30_005324 [Trapelia coarctata]|nr:hypothetical protein [Trapelia coarctata]